MSEKKYDNDQLYADLKQVINYDPNYRGWYMRCFFIIGKDEALRLASIAKADGGHVQKHFSKLLKDARARCEAKNGSGNARGGGWNG